MAWRYSYRVNNWDLTADWEYKEGGSGGRIVVIRSRGRCFDMKWGNGEDISLLIDEREIIL